MSRQIDWTQPLSEEDEAWASQFAIHQSLIEANKAEFAETSSGSLEGVDLDGEDEVPLYSNEKYWTKAKLAEEISNRDLAMPAKAKREDLVGILQADDEAAADSAGAKQ